MSYQFIEEHRQIFPVRRMCQVLGVAVSSYYAFRRRQPSQRLRDDQRLLVHIRAAHRASRQTYGYRRIYHDLRDQGIVCGQHRIARLMRQDGLRVKSRRPYKLTTRRNPRHPVADNVLKRDFAATKPNQKWVADITYITTHQGWLYLATVMDLFSRQIVGWAMDARMKTDLVKAALEMAVRRRRPEAGLLHHSDRGSQFTSADYQQLLAKHGIQVSMSRTGDCYDNAAMESFFATLKTECVDHRYPTRLHARTCVFDYIEVWYNRRRRHSALNYLSPLAFEQRFARDTFAVQ
jgi:putative transposase